MHDPIEVIDHFKAVRVAIGAANKRDLRGKISAHRPEECREALGLRKWALQDAVGTDLSAADRPKEKVYGPHPNVVIEFGNKGLDIPGKLLD